MTLDSDSQSFFADNILGLHPGICGPSIRSHQRLLEARDHFAAYLSRERQALGEEYPDWLQQLYGKITLQLNLIVYPVEDELDADTTATAWSRSYPLYKGSDFNMAAGNPFS